MIPNASQLCEIDVLTTDLIAAFIPGASPPLVRTAIRISTSFRLIDKKYYQQTTELFKLSSSFFLAQNLFP
jgi:hypothetical protein